MDLGRRALPWLVLLFVTIGIYLPALSNGFVWDDGSILTQNPLIPEPNGLWRIWFSGESLDYFPLTFSSFWIEWRLWGLRPMGYHAVNILLHAANAILVWRVLLRLCIPGAWVAALIFAVHPVNVATVAWIAERKNTLSMVFYLGAILWYLRFLASEKNLAYGLAIGLFLLALLAKTSVIMLPFVLVLIFWWQRRGLTWRDAVRLIPFFALSLAMGLLTIWFQNHRAIDGALVPMGGWLARITNAAWAVWFYLRALLFPVDLSMLYPHRRGEAVSFKGILSLVLLVIVLGFAFVRRRGWGRPVLFGSGYFIISLLPVIGFFRMYYFRLSPVADQWLYVPEIGVIALVVAAFTRISTKWYAPVLVVLLLSSLTWQRVSVLKSEETLWTDVLQKDPLSWTASTNLALLSFRRHELPQALSLARQAVKLEPDYVEGYLNLGAILDADGRSSESLACYQQAMKLRPDSAEVFAALALAQEKAGHPGDAVDSYREALRLDPHDYQSYINLGSILYRQGRFPEAVVQFREAIRERPDAADAHNDLAGALYLSGDLNNAIQEYREALLLQPSHQDARSNLDALLKLPK